MQTSAQAHEGVWRRCMSWLAPSLQLITDAAWCLQWLRSWSRSFTNQQVRGSIPRFSTLHVNVSLGETLNHDVLCVEYITELCETNLEL